MMVHTCNTYRPLSRRRKKLPPRPRRAKQKFEEFVPPSEPYRRPTAEYKSVMTNNKIEGADVDFFKQEISKQYPVAPAYNKGAYQVIPSNDITHIGK